MDVNNETVMAILDSIDEAIHVVDKKGLPYFITLELPLWMAYLWMRFWANILLNCSPL